jgi:hypothetical protein
MEKFDSNYLDRTLHLASANFRSGDVEYKKHLISGFSYLKNYLNEELYISVINELERKFPELDVKEPHSKQNVSLYIELCGLIEIIRPR